MIENMDNLRNKHYEGTLPNKTPRTIKILREIIKEDHTNTIYDLPMGLGRVLFLAEFSRQHADYIYCSPSKMLIEEMIRNDSCFNHMTVQKLYKELREGKISNKSIDSKIIFDNVHGTKYWELVKHINFKWAFGIPPDNIHHTMPNIPIIKKTKDDILNFKEEQILCAAIWFDDGKEYPHQPKNIDTGLVFCGYMHANIFPQIGGTMGERKELGIHEREQGFLTNRNRFVGRKEAAKIALESGQIKELKYFKDKLDSCDLYQ